MKPVAREAIAERIEDLDALDAVSEPLQKAVRTLVPQESELKDVLSDTWLGHPVHPPLTDVVVGAWTSALLLDLVGGEDAEEAADRLVAAGILAAVPTAAAGLSDWAELDGGSRRIGSVHAIGNTTALALHALSWAARRRGARGRGVVLSALGYGIATFSPWLGGHLSFGKGVGVNQAAFEDPPREWTAVLGEAEIEEGKLIAARANGAGILLVRKGVRLYALADRCSHRGCPLHEGELNDDTVICPATAAPSASTGASLKGRPRRRSRRSRSARATGKSRSAARRPRADDALASEPRRPHRSVRRCRPDDGRRVRTNRRARVGLIARGRDGLEGDPP